MTLLDALLLFGAGLAAGFINVVAGGGSLLTLPLLIVLGLPPAVANGTNRVAIVAQNIVAVAKFRREGIDDLRLGLRLSVPAVIGALIGSQLAVFTPDRWFKTILAGVMVVVLVSLLRGKSKTSEDPTAEQLGHRRWQLPMMFVVGLYGGYIQAGVGYLLLFALSVVGGLSLVRSNSLKVIIVGAYMVPSLLVFIANGKVAWVPAAALTVGNALGGWLGSAFSIKKGDRWIRWVLAAAVLALVGKLLGLYG
jgi:uncharacterized membrane protein YfcA